MMKRCIVCDKDLYPMTDPFVWVDAKLIEELPEEIFMEYVDVDDEKIWVAMCPRCHRLWMDLKHPEYVDFLSVEKLRKWLDEVFKDMDVSFI